MFENFAQLKSAFVTDKLELLPEIEVGDTTYSMQQESISLLEILTKGAGGLLYVAEGAQPIALLWRAYNNGRIVPWTATTVNGVISEATIGAGGQEADPNHIGDVVDVKITSLPNSNILKGKVDTGATISSLHADRYKINGGQVEFVSKALSNHVITVPLSDQQAVKSADGGTEYRPVIELNVKINDKVLTGQQFNLNDRGSMEHSVLIGQNVLEKGGFLINPRMNEDVTEVDWDTIIESVREVPAIEALRIEQLYTTMAKSNITFKDLFDHVNNK